MKIEPVTSRFFVRKPHIQLAVLGTALASAFVFNKYQKYAQGSTFENHIPTSEMWTWYDKHCARQGENQDIVMKDHSANITHMMGRANQ